MANFSKAVILYSLGFCFSVFNFNRSPTLPISVKKKQKQISENNLVSYVEYEVSN